MKLLDKALMIFIAALFVWALCIFIGDAIEANRPSQDSAIAHSTSELSLYYGGGDR